MVGLRIRHLAISIIAHKLVDVFGRKYWQQDSTNNDEFGNDRQKSIGKKVASPTSTLLAYFVFMQHVQKVFK